MSRRAWAAALASAVVAAVLVGTATGAGPWPGVAASVTDAHGVIYLAKQEAQATIVTATQGSEVLRTGRLWKQVIVDKRTPDEKMNGYPVARTSSAAGAWVYTLYRKVSGEPFIHALNTSGRYALCIDFDWTGGGDDIWQLRLSLNESDHLLSVVMPGGEAAVKVDTRTLKVIS